MYKYLLPQEKQKLVQEIESSQDNHREARTHVTNLAAERDQLFREKIEMSSKMQQLGIEKEQVAMVGNYIQIYSFV